MPYSNIIPILIIIVNFEITPSPLTVAVEQRIATFYCQHLRCDSISWRVNGIAENKINLPNISIQSDEIQQIGGGKIYSLSIGTLLEFNQTTVECVAVFFDGTPSQVTPHVTLLIQGLKNIQLLC